MLEIDRPEPVRPGVGVDVTRLPLAPARQALRDGSFVLDQAFSNEVSHVSSLIEANGPGVISQDELREVLFCDAGKTFRNAYSSLVIEEAWPSYSSTVAGPNRGVFDIRVDESGATSLDRVPNDQLAAMPAEHAATLIARSNQAVLSHFVCREFADSRIPEFSGDPEADKQYFDWLKLQTDLLPYLDSEFRTLPLSVGTPSVSTASGSLVLRTIVFGMPNLADKLTERDGFRLTNAEHRNGFEVSMQRSIAPYYLPTTHVSVGINRWLINPETLELRPDTWMHNGDRSNFLVYPSPEIVTQVNEGVQTRKEQGERVSGATGCPAFHSRVPASPEVDNVVPLPRSLVETSLEQLDTWYYPVRQDIAS